MYTRIVYAWCLLMPYLVVLEITQNRLRISHCNCSVGISVCSLSQSRCYCCNLHTHTWGSWYIGSSLLIKQLACFSFWVENYIPTWGLHMVSLCWTWKYAPFFWWPEYSDTHLVFLINILASWQIVPASRYGNLPPFLANSSAPSLADKLQYNIIH